MSLIAKKQTKEKKSADMNKYMKEYRDKNLQHFHNIEKTKYYKKKYNLDDVFIEQYGEFSGDVYKLVNVFKDIKQKEPQLIPHILKMLETDASILGNLETDIKEK